jgi:AcrR family transcriptional regulator
MGNDTEDTTALSRPARKRNPEESRRRILDAAERAFSLRGFAGARLRDIAQEAGVHHALVHHYYGDKQGLFAEVVKRGLGRVSSAGLETLKDKDDFEAVTRAFVGVLFDFCANNQNLLRIIEGAFRDRSSVAYGVTAEALGSLAGPLTTTLKGRIEKGQASGQIRRDISADSLILLGFGAIVYRFITAEDLLRATGIAGSGEFDANVEREQAVQYVLRAMGC